MKEYRKLSGEEVARLKAQMCTAADWERIEVSADFSAEHVMYTRFSGNVRIGAFRKEFCLPGGMKKHSGLYHATLHNVVVGDDCCIENVKNYIANYEIGDGTFIENVDILLTDGPSSFGNGVEVSVMNETGGREVVIFDRLSAQTAYIMALYRHRPGLVLRLKEIIGRYVGSVSSCTGVIGSGVTIADAGYIKNVRIGDCCKIEGAARLKNGSINSNEAAPVHIGVGVIGDDFIISSGSCVEDGVTFSRCFIGQACRLGRNYSASDSLFFSNCHGENGEACAIFAGPYTVTHHKSTLLIAGMFSFMNAGSGSNQSNHLYKLGPIHQGIMERGAKTASDSYILWPAKVGAFSLVMGRHVCHQDTSDLPFSYLIEQQSTSYIVPGANLKSVGTIRSGSSTITGVWQVSGEMSDVYAYMSGKIKRSSLKNGLRYYGMAIDKFLGNSLITRIMSADFRNLRELRRALAPDDSCGTGEWVDIAGMIAPKQAVEKLADDVECGVIRDADTLNARFAAIHARYYDYEWTWACRAISEHYGVHLDSVTIDQLLGLIYKWRESVTGLDELVYEDARKEFSLNAMTSFGADGDSWQREQDFMQVRGSLFESDPFVNSVKEHMRIKSDLCDAVVRKIKSICNS